MEEQNSVQRVRFVTGGRVPTTYQIPADIKAKIGRAANAEHLSQTEWVIRACEEKLERVEGK